MRKITLVLILLVSTMSFSQVIGFTNAHLSQTPIENSENTGNGVASFSLYESLGLDVAKGNNDSHNLTILVSLNKIALKDGDVSLLTGNLLNYFDATYTSEGIIILEQTNNIPALSSATLNFPFTVIDNSNVEEANNGFMVSASAMDSTNATGYISKYTYTTEESAAVLSIEEDFDVDSDIFSVYPNPVKDVLNIKFTEFEKEFNVSLVNMLGQQVFSKANLSNEEESIDISKLSSGNYVLLVKSENKLITRKIVKE